MISQQSLLPHMPDWGPLPRHYTKDMAVTEDMSPMPQFPPWSNELYCWEHQVLSALGKELSTGIFNETSHRWVAYSVPLNEGELQVSTEILLSCSKARHVETQYTWNGTLLTEGRRWGPGLACPALSASPYVWQCCFPQPTCMICAARLHF